jgi:hypothetical protein
MRWLIRRVLRKGKGGLSYEEDTHYGEVLTIGRGSDQAIFLPDMRAALEHARITSLGGGRYRIESLILAGIRVNGEIVYATTVEAGAVVEIGGTRIELLPPPRDYDAGVQVSSMDQREQKDAATRDRRATTLAETWLSKRKPSWILFLVLIVIGGLPALAHYSPPFNSFLKDVPGLGPQMWSTGELASGHHFFGADCATCHTRPFRWVRDEACIKCHQSTPAHADPAVFSLPELGDARCAHCHRDHNGPDGLIISRQSLCADCHLGLAERTGGASTLEDYGDFMRSHPEFKVELPRWDADGNYSPERVVQRPGLEERSGLRFPHDLHLNERRVYTTDAAGRRSGLDCASCHRPEPGGAKMVPINFELHCQSCHTLGFDPTAPGRQVPHARVEEILFMLDDFYARRALEGTVVDESAPPTLRQRRRPGQPVSREERAEALAWARDKARQVGDSLFSGRACATCHRVTPPREAEQTWQIAPVRVAGVWFPKARFTHARHATFSCASCHDAEMSNSSADLLIPDIANCRGCHAGEHPERNRVSTTCIQCHGYHISGHLLQGDL